MSALLHGPLLWYLNRSTGLVVLVLLTATVLLGVLATGRGGRVLPRFVGQALHRNLALWSVVLLVVHITTAVVDTYVDIRWWQAVVPWVGATYLPLWLGLGTLAFDLLRAGRGDLAAAGADALPLLAAHPPPRLRRLGDRRRTRARDRDRPADPRLGAVGGVGVGGDRRRPRRAPTGAGQRPPRARGGVVSATPVAICEDPEVQEGPALLAGIGAGPSLAAHRTAVRRPPGARARRPVDAAR